VSAKSKGGIFLPGPVVVPVRMRSDLQYVATYGVEDDQSVIRMMLNGLIMRDCEAMSKEEWDRWAATPAGQAEIAKRKAAQEARDRGDLVMVSLSDEGGFSLRYLEVDRAGLRRLIDAGYQFDATTTAWSNENTDPGDEDRP